MGYHASYFCHSVDGLLEATAFWISFQQPNVFSGWWCIKCLYTDNIPIRFFVVAYEITFNHLKHSLSIFVMCLCRLCTSFLPFQWPLHWLGLHCNLCRTASKRRVKMPCQSLIHWLTCNLFCLAALSLRCLSTHVRVCLHTCLYTESIWPLLPKSH